MLTLSLKREYFEAIKRGEKTEEYRLCTPYWTRRLAKMQRGDLFMLMLGYPAKHEQDKRISRLWRGMQIKTIQHPHFGPERVTVFAIDVGPAQVGETLSPPRRRLTAGDEV